MINHHVLSVGTSLKRAAIVSVLLLREQMVLRSMRALHFTQSDMNTRKTAGVISR